MSRIGNRVLQIPESITLNITDQHINLSSGESKISIFYNKSLVKLIFENKEFKTQTVNSSKYSRSQFATINALVNNSVIGLTKGFTKSLEIVGVGYKAAVEGGKLRLALGYSHPIFLDIPKNIKLELISSVEIKLSSFNKEELGEFASLIRKFRSPEPYKGKGIKYKNEVILRKAGKTSDGNKK